MTSQINKALGLRDKTSIFFHPKNDITLDQLLEAVKRMVGEKGCPSCGLNGFDLNFGRDAIINPKINTVFEGLDISRVVIDQVGLPSHIVTLGR